MLRNRICATLLILCGLGFECLAQTNREQADAPSPAQTAQPQGEYLRKERLKKMMIAVGISADESPAPLSARSTHHREARILWEADPATAGLFSTESTSREARMDSFGRVLRTMGVSERAGALPRHRSLEISRHHLMVVGVGASAKLRWWTLIEDPRQIRAELPDTNGELSGQVIYRAAPEFVVQFPTDQEITELRFYHPRWTGEEFVLDLINTVSVQ
jgi:hypothetical protein